MLHVNDSVLRKFFGPRYERDAESAGVTALIARARLISTHVVCLDVPNQQRLMFASTHAPSAIRDATVSELISFGICESKPEFHPPVIYKTTRASNPAVPGVGKATAKSPSRAMYGRFSQRLEKTTSGPLATRQVSQKSPWGPRRFSVPSKIAIVPQSLSAKRGGCAWSPCGRHVGCLAIHGENRPLLHATLVKCHVHKIGSIR
jgi:hypothetical protein